MEKEIIESFEFDDEKQIITVIKRERKSGLMYSLQSVRPVPDSVFKEVYGIKDGRIELLSTQKGKHIPPQTISEQFIFKE